MSAVSFKIKVYFVLVPVTTITSSVWEECDDVSSGLKLSVLKMFLQRPYRWSHRIDQLVVWNLTPRLSAYTRSVADVVFSVGMTVFRRSKKVKIALEQAMKAERGIEV